MIALVALPQSEPPRARDLVDPLAKYFGDRARVKLSSDERSVELQVGDEEIRIAPSAQPIPRELIDAPIEDSWYWPEAAEVLARQQSHVAIGIDEAGASRARLQSLLLTRLTALVGEAFDYEAVFWEPASLVHSAKAFSDSARAMTDAELPLRIWVKFQLSENDDDTRSLYTQGLEALGFMELEVRQTSRPKENVYGWAFNIAHYMLDKGILVEDGETVGASQTEFVRIHHLPSAIDPSRTVIYIDLDLQEEMQAATDVDEFG